MKKIYIPLFLFVLTVITCVGQDIHPGWIKLIPAAVLSHEIQVAYEQKINDSFSLELTPGYIFPGDLCSIVKAPYPETELLVNKGWLVQAGARFYSKRGNKWNSYWEPQFMFKHTGYSRQFVTTKYSPGSGEGFLTLQSKVEHRVGASVAFGQVRELGQHFSFEYYEAVGASLGRAHYTIYKEAYEGRDWQDYSAAPKQMDKQWPKLILKIGVKLGFG